MRISLLAPAALAFIAPAAFAAGAPPATLPAKAPAPSAATSATLLTADENKQIDKVIASMLAAGFPDARNAVVYSGKLSVRATFDPAKSAMPLPSDASNMQETSPGSTEVTYGYQFNGLHFKLSDGSWIIALSYRFVPGKGDSVDVSAATEVKLATLTADAGAAHPIDAAQSAAKFLATVAPAQRARAAQVMNEVAPVIEQLEIDADSLPLAALLLGRAGWAQADDLCLATADIRARSYWQMRPWASADAAFDPTGEYPKASAEAQAWIKANPVFTSEPPAVALRRAMFRIARAQLMESDPEAALLPASVAAAVAKAALDDHDPQHNASRIDALAAGVKLPVTPAAKADLPTRLQSWEARPRKPKMVVTSPAGKNPSISTGFIVPPPAYVPVAADLDALVALLPDDRPSRFFDFSGPRTLGDNAWRALASLLKADPRALAGYPVDPPWTQEERHAAAKAVQKWWTTHRGEYISK